MKPAPFQYVAPHSLAAALGALGEDAKALAGGQSLVPLLNFRLARPATIVDLNGIGELSYVRKSGGTLRIGALTRQATLQRSSVVERGWPLLIRAVAHVAHPAIRNRGTVGGSVAHADPAAVLPVALTALDARFHARSAQRGTRTIPAADFFQAPLMTALEPDELLVEIEVPPQPEGARAAFVEHARTHGDFAVAGAAVVRAGTEHAAIGLLGAGPTPLRVPDAERALLNGASAAEAAAIAGAELDDDYRRALTTELVRRAIEAAIA
ncbi:MAG: aerobic carbon-monoxide dehydrogenase medium subunit [Solirubrobacteraceae bacterium]|nr:aerobic carbon-monoxide dehydrogenase medium subunit [Solirubrobacteraceae bacterium]